MSSLSLCNLIWRLCRRSVIVSVTCCNQSYLTLADSPDNGGVDVDTACFYYITCRKCVLIFPQGTCIRGKCYIDIENLLSNLYSSENVKVPFDIYTSIILKVPPSFQCYIYLYIMKSIFRIFIQILEMIVFLYQ